MVINTWEFSLALRLLNFNCEYKAGMESGFLIGKTSRLRSTKFDCGRIRSTKFEYGKLSSIVIG